MTALRFSKRVLFLILLGILLIPANLPAASGQAGAIAALDPIQGLVQFRAANAPDNAWQTLTRVQLVGEGDWVRTDHLGKAELTFFEGNTTTLLANTQIRIAKFSMTDTDSPVLVLEEPVGDVRNEIDHPLDSSSQYEVHTPSALIVVRGTDFWTSATWLGETTINVSLGITEIRGIRPDGTIGQPSFIAQNQSLYVRPDGEIGLPGIFMQPQEPPPAPLAPATCGDAICNPGEEQTCVVDCQSFPTCGNAICELQALEGPVTCPSDCVPDMRNASSSAGGVTSQIVSATNTPPPSQPCTIRTMRRDVEVRVGPGSNRSVRAYLQPNINIPVLGKAADSEGTLWWKIQPPDYTAAEADRYWVRVNDVEASGDCAAVQDAAASQIIAPPPPPQPTQAPNATQGPSPTLPAVSISFYSNKSTVDPYLSECARISWDVEGIQAVYFQGAGVIGHDSRRVCPTSTTTYELKVVLLDGSITYRYLTISTY